MLNGIYNSHRGHFNSVYSSVHVKSMLNFKAGRKSRKKRYFLTRTPRLLHCRSQHTFAKCLFSSSLIFRISNTCCSSKVLRHLNAPGRREDLRHMEQKFVLYVPPFRFYLCFYGLRVKSTPCASYICTDLDSSLDRFKVNSALREYSHST